jgi:hypothetical protein
MPNVSGPITIRQGFELASCDVVEEDQRHDLALLRLDTNPSEVAARAVYTERPRVAWV